MKKFILILSSALLLAGACSRTSAPHPEWTYDAVLYEVNIRQFSPEASFAGVQVIPSGGTVSGTGAAFTVCGSSVPT